MFRVQSGRHLVRPQRQDGPQPALQRPARPEPASTAGAPAPALTAPAALTPVSPQEARALLRQASPPAALAVSGTLNLSGSAWLRFLPDWLRCEALIVDDCPHLTALPADLHAGRVSARRCPELREVTGRLSVREGLNLSGSGVRTIHADLHATRLTLARCRDLINLAGTISVSHLDVRGCAGLRDLPPSLHVTQTLDVADSGLTALPPHIRAGLRWNDVPVEPKVAFTPELLTGHDVLRVRNVQRRRVLLDRIGVEKFLADVGGLILDRDEDAGGQRQLVRVPFDDDEDLVAVVVRCPSTGGTYALRVPPHLRTCRDAVAWTAGLSASEYHPVQEA